MSSLTAPDLRAHLIELLQAALAKVAPEFSAASLTLERPKSAEHGDFSSNIAMQLGKSLKRNPRDIAQALINALPGSDLIEQITVAGAGFVNFRLKPEAKQRVVKRVLTQAEKFGRTASPSAKRVQVEFVSANPTGPLHVGHGRGAAYGACLANVLEATGCRVTREFYINDAGRQMDILATSVWLRYLEARGTTVVFPEDGYRGDYVRDIARALDAQHSSRLVRDFPAREPTGSEDADAALDALMAGAKTALGENWWLLHKFALDAMLADQRDDLEQFGVHYDRWFSERSLYDSGEVARAVETLRVNGHAYEKEGALWFRSTEFGDEKDRVVCRENGQFTYFASDIAYHLNKFERGYDQIIDVWGADHHGYIPRVKGALKALGADPEKLTVPLVQFAVLYRGGEKVAMGKRAGEFVTLRELRNEVGNDAARFYYVLRKSDQHLDFDLDLAKSQSNDNPVYYIQYAHARVCSVLEQWAGEASGLVNANLAPLVEAQELQLMQLLMDFPDHIDSAARDLAPHQIAFYLKELAGAFHSYYNSTRLLVDDEDVKLARLALAAAVRQVLRNGLAILGVGAPQKM
jgi:arginyl-tRNA synthetase